MNSSQPKTKQFELTIDGFVAILDCELSKNEMTITHTFVPQELRGKGIAAQLMKMALSYAETNGFVIKPQCSYAVTYMKRHKCL
jgi:predicted GNAT family acetyltransferase